MRRWEKLGGGVLAGAAAAAAATEAVASRVWDRATAHAVDRLADPDAGDGAPAVFSPDELAGLPAPVVRYFTFALTPGQRLLRGARLYQSGRFRLSADSWAPMTAVCHVSVRPPGFVWDATIRPALLLPVRVRDSYLRGEGAMSGRVAALVPVVDRRGTREMAAGSLHRYLAEAPWFPTALLPSAGVRWEAVDDGTARATLTDGPVTVSVDVHFGSRGEIAKVTAYRFRDVDGEGVLTPFVGHLREYRRLSGMMIPTEGEAVWMLPRGPYPYWRGRIVGVDYELAP